MVLVALALLLANPETTEASASACDLRLGAMVTKEETAKAIFNALAEERMPPGSATKYELKIEDQGDKWLAFQSLPVPEPTVGADGKPVFYRTFGGGGLSLQIAKCDGRIIDPTYQK